jgi:hypothetical protein
LVDLVLLQSFAEVLQLTNWLASRAAKKLEKSEVVRRQVLLIWKRKLS